MIIKRNTFTWLRAVTAADRVSAKGQALRLANSMFLHADNKTGLGWATQETLGAVASIRDRSNFWRQKKLLEDVGAITAGLVMDLADEVRPKGLDPRRTFYRLNLDWAVEFLQASDVVDPTTEEDMVEGDVVGSTTGRCQIDNKPLSDQQQDVVRSTALSNTSPTISPNLPATSDMENGRKRSISDPGEIKIALQDAIDLEDCTPLLSVVWKGQQHLFDEVFGPGSYRRWGADVSINARKAVFSEIVAELGGRNETSKAS